MPLGDRARNELIRAIAEQLNYFEWIDQHHGAYATEAEWSELRKQSEFRLNHDPVFHTKTRSMLNRIEFVMIDPATVEERTKESLERFEHYAQMLSQNLGISKTVALQDLFTADYTG